jgi:hypothetical protein
MITGGDLPGQLRVARRAVRRQRLACVFGSHDDRCRQPLARRAEAVVGDVFRLRRWAAYR